MVTREEQHSTRGRARLLFEMLEGNPLTDGWRDETVKEALDLCLACKGCRGECPVNVDMATYKAEFLSHYYAGRRRPIAAYAFGLMYWWARAAAHAPRLANGLTQTPGLRTLAKLAATMHPRRAIPAFARQTFRRGFRGRTAPNASLPPVILWPDTWNDHFHPDTAWAAVDVLEAAGHRVIVPAVSLCCGRPLYDYGMLTLARTLLRRVLSALRPHIRAGVPVVGLEPSCISVFRDEMVNLLPRDEDARRLRDQTFLITEFLADHAPHFAPPALRASALVHGHCHEKAMLDFDCEATLLARIGVEYTVLDSGCCGMAGAFGFERAHYDVSIACGERVLLPQVRAASPDTLIVANGFSCREQIVQTTNRRPIHLVEVLKRALDEART
jgi:Fe-S oxidoreductase